VTNANEVRLQPINVTNADRERILAALWRRNALRRGAGMPLLDIKREFRREIANLETRRYLAHLEPFLIVALRELGGSPGIAGRIVQRLLATQIARRRLFETTGIEQPKHGLSTATGSPWYVALLRVEKTVPGAARPESESQASPN